jgi:hypothetical protein
MMEARRAMQNAEHRTNAAQRENNDGREACEKQNVEFHHC